MSSKTSIRSLQKTHESLKQIQERLEPFLDLITQYDEQQSEENNKTIDLYEITEAEAAIALSIGTLRYMALRLRGKKSSDESGKNDTLRMELDKIRKTLVELRKLKKKIKGSNTNVSEEGKDEGRKTEDIQKDGKRKAEKMKGQNENEVAKKQR